MIRHLYLDSANLTDIRRFVRTDAIAGVTTNPSLMAKEEKGDYVQKLVEICEVITTEGTSAKHLSVEVTTLDPERMVTQALELQEELSKFNKVNLHIKVPITCATLETITQLTRQRVAVNATAAMTPLQAKLAEDAGAPVVSFFYNRIIDVAEDADRAISYYVRNLRRSSTVICGSIRSADDVRKCWLNGAEVVTASAKIIENMAFHRQTESAIRQFQEDIERWEE